MSKENKVFYGGVGLVIFSFMLILLFGKGSTLIFLISIISLCVFGYGYYLRSKTEDNRQAKLHAKEEINKKGKEIERLNQLLKDQMITEEQYESKKREIEMYIKDYKNTYFGE